MNNGKYLVIGLVILIVLGLGCIGDTSSKSGTDKEKAPITTPTPKLTTEEIKSKATIVLYDDLLRNNEEYIGKIVRFKVFVIQVNDYGYNRYDVIGFPLKQTIHNPADTTDIEKAAPLYLTYEGKRILNNDVIEIWGKITGIKNYISVQGGQLSAPEINVLYTEIIQKAP